MAREWLASTLWPDTDQSIAFANLRPVLYELRRALGDEAYRLSSPDRTTICLDLEGADADVVEFDAAVRRGSISDLAQAVALYAGPLLEGCPEEWAIQERNKREKDCIDALHSLGAKATERGDFPQAIALYHQLVVLDPWSDAPRRGLMEVLSRSGDVNAALQCYRDFSRALSREFASAPDLETTDLYQRLRSEIGKGTNRPSSNAPERPVPRVQGHLPHTLSSLVGRDDERLDVAETVRRHRLVTLVGPGGIGKTRLATQVACDTAIDYPDGAWFISLEGLTDDHLVATQVANTLGLKETPAVTPVQSIVAAIRPKRLLLVLDNCEHLLEAVVAMSFALLRECGELRILATSRQAFGVTGEKVWPVPALATPDPRSLPEGRATRLRVVGSFEGVQLFADRARSANSSFEITQESALTVAQICSRLDGVPLAIELAAARSNSMTTNQILDRLGDHLGLLVGGDRAGAERHQTLRATLDWSYALLGQHERTLLHRLSTFAGGWTLEAAEQVVTSENLPLGNVADLLRALVDRSMVGFDDRTGRFHLLETVRQYASEKLCDVGEKKQISILHREWCQGMASEAESRFNQNETEPWLIRLDAETANLRAALAESESDPPALVRLAGSLWRYWYLRGRFREGLEQLEKALCQSDPETPERSKAAYGAGILADCLSDYGTARRHFEECLRLVRQAGDAARTGAVLNGLAFIFEKEGNFRAARPLRAESLELCRQSGSSINLATFIANEARNRAVIGELTEGRALYEEGVAAGRENDDRRGAALCLMGLGAVLTQQGHFALARRNEEEALQIFRELDYRLAVAQALEYLAKIALEEGNWAAAETYALESVGLSREMGQLEGTVASLLALGAVMLEKGDIAGAGAIHAEAFDCVEACSIPFLRTRVLVALAKTSLRRNEQTSALAHLVQSVSLCAQIDDPRCGIESLEWLARVICGDSNVDHAARLWGAAEEIRESLGIPIPPTERPDYDQSVRLARFKLGEASFSRYWREGKAMEWRTLGAEIARFLSPGEDEPKKVMELL